MNGPEGKSDSASARRRQARRRDRRYWERIPSGRPRASLSWREGDADRTIWGELVNIGGEGASFRCEGASFRCEAIPPSGVPVWLALEDGAPRGGRLEPVESRLVAVAEDPSGVNVARLRFVDACPIDLFDLAVGRPG